MQPIAEEYGAVFGVLSYDTTHNRGTTPNLYSSLTGRLVSSEELQLSDYWVSNGLSPVRFSDTVSYMFADSAGKSKKLGVKTSPAPITELLKIGPHAALQGPVREILAQIPGSKDTSYASVLNRGVDAMSTCLAASGWLYCRGHFVDIESINSGDVTAPSQMLVDLPSYLLIIPKHTGKKAASARDIDSGNSLGMSFWVHRCRTGTRITRYGEIGIG